MFKGLHEKIETIRTYLASADAFLKNIQKFLYDLGDITGSRKSDGFKDTVVVDIVPQNKED